MRARMLLLVGVACGGRGPGDDAKEFGSSTPSTTAAGPSVTAAAPTATPGAAASEAVVALPPDAPWILTPEETVAVVAIRGEEVQATVRSAAAASDIEQRIDRVLAVAGCTATLPESLGADRVWHCADPVRGYRGLHITLGTPATDGARPVSLVWFRRATP